MAATTKKRTTTKKTGKKDTLASRQAKKQMWAVVLFATGILMGALTIIKGDKLWLSIHNILLGLFGWSVFFIAPLIIYIAVIAARDRPVSAIKVKLWQVFALILVISGAIQIFGTALPDELSFFENVVSLYDGGKALTGGGVASFVFAWPLISLFDILGAKIIIVLAIFVFVMLITGSTLISLFNTARKPVQTLEEAYTEAVENRDRRKAETVQRKPAKAASVKAAKKARFDIDVDISADNEPLQYEEDLPEHPVISNQPEMMTEPSPPSWGPKPDSPVEYISPDEFLRTEELPTQDTIPELKRAHPLEDDIMLAEQTETPDINDIIGRFFSDDTSLTQTDVIDMRPPHPDESAIPNHIERVEAAIPTTYEYLYPPVNLLKHAKAASNSDISEELKNNAQTLVDTLKSFGVQTRITDICRGPAVTRYELQPSAGVKISKITGLSDDIALNLASAGIRIEAPIPNKAAVGIEVPNKVISMVSIREIIDSPDFSSSKSSLTVALGKDIAGKITLADLGRMPHMLIAGATGSGKSVCINSIIVSLLYKSSPDAVKLLMVDPKVVELGIYNGIPHLLVPVVTDPKKAAGALNWAVAEMLKRYKTFAEFSVRDLEGYNKLAAKNKDLQPMPKIVIIIDELADLMMAAPNEVEDSICRLAQMARAAGMHLVIATQRPSVDVITGVIKANIPSRIAFAVSSQVDSRTILDMGGAEKLLGRGDMLFYPVGAAKPIRVQGCFVTDPEVEKVVGYVKEGDTTDYDQNIVEEIDRHVVAEKGKGKSSDDGGGFDDDDEMLPQAIECVVEMGQASTSSLQRRLRLGYARAARIIDQLEQKGIVGPFEGSKPRQVLISKDRWLEMKLSGNEESLLKSSASQNQTV